MSRPEPIHLIIADPSENSAEELVSELRNAGHATRARHISTIDELDGLLTGQRWDLLLCRRDPEAEYEPEDVIAQVRQHELDCAVLLLEADNDLARLTAGIRSGATDVILEGEDDRFLLVVERELANVAERRKRRHAELAMKESERRNQLLLDTSSAAIAYVHEGMHIYANRAYVELFGYESQDDLAAMPMLDMIASEGQATFKQKLKEFDAEAAAEAFPIRGLRQDESAFDAKMSLTMAAFDGEPCMQVLIRKEQQEQAADKTQELQQIRSQDPTTGLLNRPFFLERLEQAVEDARRERHSGGLLMIHLDDFPAVKEAAGLTGTDSVVREVAEALAAVTPESATLARLGDDAFCALTIDSSREDLKELGESYRGTIENLLCSAGEKTVQVTASIGMSMIGSRSESAQEALDQANRATSHVRELDKAGNGVYLFDPADFVTTRANGAAGDDEQARRILELLSEGIKGNSLVLLFQPIISLHGEEQQHYEVYLRLPDGEGNLLAPDDFIHLAEQAGMGGRIDRWVVLQSVRKLAAQRGQGLDARLTINLTHAALTDDSFLPWLKVALKAAKLPREAVVLQFTEIAATTYLKQAKAFTEALGRLECMGSLSRFGGSVNPFGTLRHLSVEYVKLDGAFSSGLTESDEEREALRGTLRQLEEGGHRPVVPMVSDAQVLAQLFQAGVNYVQGNYFAEPTTDMDYEFGTEV